MPGEGIYQIVGKTIERVIVKTHRAADVRPSVQVFLIFTDHTYYELYGERYIGFTGGVDRGGRDQVIRYMNSGLEVAYEAYLGEDGKPVAEYPPTTYHEF